jgi:two-component system chemotaxis response regulator CheY
MPAVLTVDDSEPMRKMLAIVLKAGGYNVDSACHGAEGIEIFGQARHDLIITDINMPIMHGIEFIEQIRRIDSEVPILALTTESEDTMRRRGFAAGANGWVLKPFKPVQFMDVVRQIVADT